jgi:hypothetical protein
MRFKTNEAGSAENQRWWKKKMVGETLEAEYNVGLIITILPIEKQPKKPIIRLYDHWVVLCTVKDLFEFYF